MTRGSRMFGTGDLLTGEEGRALEIAREDLERQLERGGDPRRQAELAGQLASLDREWAAHRESVRGRKARDKRGRRR